MVRYTQTIGRLLPKNCLSVLDHFLGLALEKLKAYLAIHVTKILNAFSAESGNPKTPAAKLESSLKEGNSIF